VIAADNGEHHDPSASNILAFICRMFDASNHEDRDRDCKRGYHLRTEHCWRAATGSSRSRRELNGQRPGPKTATLGVGSGDGCHSVRASL